ncbi:MAG: FAD-dependent oxidoreductase, partial [Desulfobacula sp.]|nr:FAD-dependent oxidoreductase [Desulfobacula sp.]
VDMVFSFNGLSPNIDFAKGSGIDIDYGILVNEYLKTNVDSIYACGSCAQIYNPTTKNYTTSIGWPNAVVQGEVAAFNLLGDHKIIESVGRKYFDLEGVKIKTTWWEDIDDEV